MEATLREMTKRRDVANAAFSFLYAQLVGTRFFAGEIVIMATEKTTTRIRKLELWVPVVVISRNQAAGNLVCTVVDWNKNVGICHRYKTFVDLAPKGTTAQKEKLN